MTGHGAGLCMVAVAGCLGVVVVCRRDINLLAQRGVPRGMSSSNARRLQAGRRHQQSDVANGS